MLVNHQTQFVHHPNHLQINMLKLLGLIVLVVATCCEANPISEAQSCIGTCPKTDNVYHIVLLASSHCRLYCKCEAGRPTVFTCRSNWYFSIDEGTCVPMLESKCKNPDEEYLTRVPYL